MTSHRRRLFASEQFKMQGMDPDQLVAVVSSNLMGRLAGNAMSVPILVHLFNSVLPRLFPELA